MPAEEQHYTMWSYMTINSVSSADNDGFTVNKLAHLTVVKTDKITSKSAITYVKNNQCTPPVQTRYGSVQLICRAIYHRQDITHRDLALQRAILK